MRSFAAASASEGPPLWASWKKDSSGKRQLAATLSSCASLTLACSCLLLCGCSKRNSEPRITGRPSAAPVSLRCAWTPGYRYHLRVEMEVLTEPGVPDPNEAGQHRVTFAQECLVTATNTAKGGNVGLDLEILALAMERAKGASVALTFDSEQGGEASDDYGYIPVMTNLIGGHLQFLVSADGKMLRATGINEWLARAMSDAPASVRTPTPRMVANRPPPNPPPDDPALATNAIARVIRQVTRPGASGGAPAGKGRSTVANTLRNLFTQDQFRQLIEFHFIPSAPVRVHEEWKAQGEILISGHGRFHYNAAPRFAGWQQHGQTNCARIDAHGKLAAPGTSTSTNAPPKPDTLKGSVWINQELAFPVTTMLDLEMPRPDNPAASKQGTNNVPAKNLPKSVHEHVAISLLEVGPIDGAQ